MPSISPASRGVDDMGVIQGPYRSHFPGSFRAAAAEFAGRPAGRSRPATRRPSRRCCARRRSPMPPRPNSVSKWYCPRCAATRWRRHGRWLLFSAKPKKRREWFRFPRPAIGNLPMLIESRIACWQPGSRAYALAVGELRNRSNNCTSVVPSICCRVSSHWEHDAK